MRRRGMAAALAAMLTIGSALTGCGGGGTGGTTAASTAAPTETAASQAETSVGETNAAAKELNYISTFDVASAGDVALDVMITSLGDSDGGPYLRGVMDDYMAMYPNVKLNPVECSMNDLYTTLITQATAGTLPDIFTMTEAYSANCLEMGMSVDNMAELLGDEYLNGLMEAAVDNATVDGTLVYMPWQNNITAMVYRKDLFEERPGMNAWKQRKP